MLCLHTSFLILSCFIEPALYLPLLHGVYEPAPLLRVTVSQRCPTLSTRRPRASKYLQNSAYYRLLALQKEGTGAIISFDYFFDLIQKQDLHRRPKASKLLAQHCPASLSRKLFNTRPSEFVSHKAAWWSQNLKTAEVSSVY